MNWKRAWRGVFGPAPVPYKIRPLDPGLDLESLCRDLDNIVAKGFHPMRTFETGATRDTDEGKLHLKDYLSPTALLRYGEYMRQHGPVIDGTPQPDNWKKGIPIDAYMDSLVRHVLALWKQYDTSGTIDQDAACAVLFNTFGLLHETVKPLFNTFGLLHETVKPRPPLIRYFIDAHGQCVAVPEPETRA